jgi:lambda family phage portal protein
VDNKTVDNNKEQKRRDYAMHWGSVSGGQYNSGSRVSRELSCWNPVLQSADADTLRDKEAVEARALDLARNNGYIKGSIESVKNRVVGSNFRLQLRPMTVSLGYQIGEVDEWVRTIEQAWESWANDPECFVDARRQMTFTQIIRECVGSNAIYGEYFLSREWKRTDKTPFGTCFLSVEPERIETPQKYANEQNTRAGVKMDSYGEAVGYYVRTRHRRDVNGLFGSNGSFDDSFTYQPKYNDFGWMNFIHIFERDRPNQTRGFSPMASVIQKLKMLDRYEDAELEASINAATYAMVLKSDLGAGALDALQGDDAEATVMYQYQSARQAFNTSSALKYDGMKVPQLFPNEELQLLSPNHPNSNSNEFKLGMHQHMARGIGTSYEEYTGDYSRTTYSSARVSMNIADNQIKSLKEGKASKLATIMFRLWLDEAMTRGLLPLPPRMDVTQYFANKSKIANCEWLGSGRVIIDEVKHQKAMTIALSNGTTTLQQACAEEGKDWEEILRQRKTEQDLMLELGLTFKSVSIVDESLEDETTE